MKRWSITSWRRYATAVLLIALLQTSQAIDWYVATNGTGLGTNGWANATNSLQGAINISAVNDTIWVSNGLYADGGVTNYPAGSSLTNRVAIWKSITVRSKDNDPTNTIIKGAWDAPSTTNGPAAVRCVYMTNNSWLIGFTLTNGATFASGANYNLSGGGVFCHDTTAPTISNCLITGNSACGAWEFWGGGGAYYGTLYNCVLTGNFTTVGGTVASGGGTQKSILYNCTLTGNTSWRGGGAAGGALYNCIVTKNWVSGANGGGGGVANYCTLYNCLLTGNSASRGGGAYNGCALYNCTLVGNTDSSAWCVEWNCALNNCIVYLNNGNWGNGITFTNSCTTPSPGGTGNITNNPMWINSGSGYGLTHIAGNYHLTPDSPCINRGTNLAYMTNSLDARSKDLDGRRRIKYGTVDMGAYELIRAGSIYTIR